MHNYISESAGPEHGEEHLLKVVQICRLLVQAIDPVAVLPGSKC